MKTDFAHAPVHRRTGFVFPAEAVNYLLEAKHDGMTKLRKKSLNRLVS
jgi:hypothetical protein